MDCSCCPLIGGINGADIYGDRGEDTEHRKQLDLEVLRAEIIAGRASGPGKPADTVFDRLEARYAAMAKAG
ncbi:MAG TPA: hypothetical protein PKW04_08470 [Novosphingobium sp.]|nr:hypothetical protein [Novosphingobium sp.]